MAGGLNFGECSLPPTEKKRGLLRIADPKTAAVHLLSLLESELLLRVLLGVMDSAKPEAVWGTVRRAVEAFLSGYQRR